MLEIAHRAIGRGALGQNIDMPRQEFAALGQAWYRLGIAAMLEQNLVAQAVPNFPVGIARRHVFIICECQLIAAALLVRGAAIDIGDPLLRIEPNGFGEVRNRPVELAQLG